MSGRQCRPNSDDTFCGIWSGFSLFAQAWMSQYLGPASVAQLDARLTGDQEVVSWNPPGLQHSFAQIGHEIFSEVILSFLLIQKKQLSVSGKWVCKSTS